MRGLGEQRAGGPFRQTDKGRDEKDAQGHPHVRRREVDEPVGEEGRDTQKQHVAHQRVALPLDLVGPHGKAILERGADGRAKEALGEQVAERRAHRRALPRAAIRVGDVHRASVCVSNPPPPRPRASEALVGRPAPVRCTRGPSPERSRKWRHQAPRGTASPGLQSFGAW